MDFGAPNGVCGSAARAFQRAAARRAASRCDRRLGRRASEQARVGCDRELARRCSCLLLAALTDNDTIRTLPGSNLLTNTMRQGYAR